MSERRKRANRRNAQLSTGPVSHIGKQKSALNAIKHGLSSAIDPSAESVRAMARLLLPASFNDALQTLAIEAARRMVDHARVRHAYRNVYEQLFASCDRPAHDSTSSIRLLLAKAGVRNSVAGDFVEQFFEISRPQSISDLARQLDKLARYDRRALSARDRALAELDLALSAVPRDQ